jgi:tape measure domain-containing protein
MDLKLIISADANGAITAVRQLDGHVVKMSGSVKGSVSAFENLSSSIKGFAISLGVYDLASSAVGRLKQTITETAAAMVNTTAMFETSHLLLKRIFGTAEGGKQAFGWLLDQRLPFAIDTMQGQFVKLQQAGLDPMGGSLRDISDAVSAFGGNTQHFERATVAITQMAGKGVVSTEELRQQLSESIPSAARDMAKGLGMSMPEMMKAIEKGEVEATRGISAMMGVWKEKYGGASKDMQATWTGMVAAMKTQWSILLNSVMQQGVFESLKKSIEDVGVWLKTKLDDGSVARFGQSLKEAFDTFKTSAVWIAKHYDEIMLLVTAWVAYKVLIDGLPGKLLNLASAATSALTAIKGAENASSLMGLAFKNSLPAIWGATDALGKLQVAGSLLAAAVVGWQIGDYLQKEFSAVRKFGVGIVAVIIGAWEVIVAGAKLAGGLIAAVLTGNPEKIKTAWDSASQGLSEYKSRIKELWADTDRQPGAVKSVNDTSATDAARAKAKAEIDAEQQRAAAQKAADAAQKEYIADIKNNIAGVKEYASAMKDLGKERLEVANDKFKDALEEEFRLYGEGARKIEDTIKPLRKYGTEINAVYNERLANEKRALDKLSTMYVEFQQKVKINASSKEIKQHGVEILKEVRSQATEIIKVETDRYKTLLAGEQEYAGKVLGLIRAKKKEVEDLKVRFADANKTFEENKRSATGDYSGGYAYLDPNLDPLAKRQAMIDKLRADEAAYEQISDPARKREKMLGLIDAWDKLGEKVDVVTRKTSSDFSQAFNFQGFIPETTVETVSTVLDKSSALAEVEQERIRLQEKIVSGAQAEQSALESMWTAAQSKVEAYKQKVVELDNLLKSLTQDITINLQVKGLDQLAAIQGVSGGVTFTGDTPFVDISAPIMGSNAVGTSYVSRTGLYQLHRGEAVSTRAEVSKAASQQAPSQITIGDINITLPNLTKVNERTADELARAMVPKIKQYMARYA